ncbi:MAG TPA: carboxypeptidase-like regulatory domain-containing protein, partial [Terriglobales bacterium]|nr:carboxypeptidase-like regulatory domain-containing protein [Terriglobales bacterium]
MKSSLFARSLSGSISVGQRQACGLPFFGRCVMSRTGQTGVVFASLCALVLSSALAIAGVTASISGTVKDASGAIVAGATVKAVNTETGITQTQTTNAQGFYAFQALPLGHYNVEIQQPGFKGFRATNLVLDVNSALVVDATLQVGEIKEVMQVSGEALRVETASSQLGEVIGGNEMTVVPLVTRSYTDLLALQPGVVSQASGMTGAYAGAFNSAGFAVPQVSGDLNGGALSVNGQREANNGFLLNGAIVRE